MIFNLLKIAVAVVAAPVAIIADIVTIPASSCDLRRGAFDKTSSVLDSIAKNFNEAVK